MIRSFSQWMSVTALSEAVLPKDMRSNPFITLHQKDGDFVYFGVHDLSRYYQENGYLPNLEIQQIMPKLGRITDADPIEQTVSVATNRDPYHYGYHKLEDPDGRAKRKAKGSHMSLPISYLQDITHMLQGGSGLSGQSLWLVIDSNTKLQPGLMKEIRKKEVANAQQQQTPAAPQLPEITPDQLDQFRNDLRSGMPDQGQQPAPKSWNDLFPDDKPQTGIQKFRMQNREVQPQFGMNSQLRRKRFQPLGDENFGLDIAGYDPTLTKPYDIHWKQHNDSRHYEYFPE